MCLEMISDEDLRIMFENMSEEELRGFWREEIRLMDTIEKFKKAKVFYGGKFTSSTFHYPVSRNE